MLVYTTKLVVNNRVGKCHKRPSTG